MLFFVVFSHYFYLFLIFIGERYIYIFTFICVVNYYYISILSRHVRFLKFSIYGFIMLIIIYITLIEYKFNNSILNYYYNFLHKSSIYSYYNFLVYFNLYIIIFFFIILFKKFFIFFFIIDTFCIIFNVMLFSMKMYIYRICFFIF